MSINELEEEIAEKKRKLSLLKQGNTEEDYIPGCGGDCGGIK